MPLVVLRADAGAAIGSGHVMRCLALSAAFAEGGWTIGFAASAETFASVRVLAEGKLEKLTLPDGGNEAAAMAERWPEGADVLVVDHYGRDVGFERACRPWAKRILVIDDLADRAHDADVLADPVQTVEAYRKLVPAECSILAGPRYAILHPKYRKQRELSLQRRDGRPVERVLVSFGQVDPPNATAYALAALNDAGFAGDIDVVLGGAARHLTDVRAKARGRVRLHVDTAEMAALMSAADLAIGAGGGTAWERCCLGLPSIVVEIADNQRDVISMLTREGAAISAGKVDSKIGTRITDAFRAIAGSRKRIEVSKAAAALVDGRGAQRVMLAAIGGIKTKHGNIVSARLAEAGDDNWLFALQSKPETRKHANNPNPPTIDGHLDWCRQVRDDPDRLLMIVQSDGKNAGMLRLDGNNNGNRVSVAIDPDFHRLGVGAAALELASSIAGGRPLEAEILPDNEASKALFMSQGYRKIADRLYIREPR